MASRQARNDLRCVSLEHKLGVHASPTCVMSFGDDGRCKSDTSWAKKAGACLHVHHDEQCPPLGRHPGAGIAERAYQQAAAFAKSRVQSKDDGSPKPDPVSIVHHPDVRRMLMSMRAQTEAMRALGYYTAAGIDERCARPTRRRAARSRPGRPADPDREGLVHRPRQRDRLHGCADPRRHGFHRGDEGCPASARCAHLADLRGHQRYSGARSCRPQDHQGWRRDDAGPRGRDARAGR